MIDLIAEVLLEFLRRIRISDARLKVILFANEADLNGGMRLCLFLGTSSTDISPRVHPDRIESPLSPCLRPKIRPTASAR